MRPIRVLIVSQYFSPESFQINEVVQSLLNKGVEVDVLTGKPNYPEGTFFYCITAEFPQLSRQWKGTPDASFEKGGGGPPGGRRGPPGGGQQDRGRRPGGGPPGGMRSGPPPNPFEAPPFPPR